MNPTALFSTSQASSSQPSPITRQASDEKGSVAAPCDPSRFSSSDRSPTDKGDRDSRGRFAPGNKGGPGNPFARRCAALRQALLEEVTPGDLKAIMRALIDQARVGDLAAAKLVLAYAIGKPAKAVDPDAVDVHEFQLWQQSAVATQDLSGVLGRMQAGLVNEFFRSAVPSVQETAADNLGQAMRDSLPDACNSAGARPAAATEPPAEESNSQRPVATPAAAGEPRPKEKPARDPRRDKHETSRHRRDGMAEAGRAGAGHFAADTEAEEAEEDVLLEAMFRDYERKIRLGLLREIAGRVIDHQRPEKPGDQPPPLPNGFSKDRTPQ